MISRACIEAMKPGVILVNTARGAIVDEEAMIEALKSGQIRHAGLDVFNIEPLPADHPLTKLDNVTLSAHSAFRTPGGEREFDAGGVGALPADREEVGGQSRAGAASLLPLRRRWIADAQRQRDG